MEIKNIFESLPEGLSRESFEMIVKTDKVNIERIVSKGHSSPDNGWYDQSEDEWIMLLKGKAVLAFDDGNEVKLSEGDHLTIGARTKHKVKWTTPDTETIWLTVHY